MFTKGFCGSTSQVNLQFPPGVYGCSLLFRGAQGSLRATFPRVPSREHTWPPRAWGCHPLRTPCWDPHSRKRRSEAGRRTGLRVLHPGQCPADQAGRETAVLQALPGSARHPLCAGERLAAASGAEPVCSQRGVKEDSASRPRAAPQVARVARGLHRAGHVPVLP